MKEIFNRRSVRNFEEKPVEREKIDKLLKAAMQAPSAGNQQPWEFIVVENKDTLNKLSEMSPYSKMVAKAPVAIVILGNHNNLKYPGYWEQDLGAATENLLLEAVHLGLGGVWLGVAPLEDRMNYVKEMFDVPENVLAFAVVPIGYPTGEQKFVDRYDSTRVHYEKY
jgi:nitroreductase